VCRGTEVHTISISRSQYLYKKQASSIGDAQQRGSDHESDSASSEMPSLTERSSRDEASLSSSESSSIPMLEEIQPPVRSGNVRRNAVPSSINLTSTNREVTFNPLLPFVLNRGHIQDAHAALLFNPLTQFIIQSMASTAGRTSGVGRDDNRADPQLLEQLLLSSLFLDDDRASLLLDPQLHPPVDVRRQDQLVCPTCMVVHLPVEGSIAIPTTTQVSEEQNDQDNESCSAFFRATDDEDSDSMPPLEDIDVVNGEEVEHNELTNEVKLETHSINEVSVYEEEDEGIDDEDSRSTDQSLLNRGFEISRDDDLFIDASSLSNSTSSGNIVQSSNDNDGRDISEEMPEARSPFLRFLIERTTHQVNTTEDTNHQVPSNPITHLRDYGAIRCFATATCPVCLDEFNPIVALQCGHCVCGPCFEQLGGYLASSDMDK